MHNTGGVVAFKGPVFYPVEYILFLLMFLIEAANKRFWYYFLYLKPGYFLFYRVFESTFIDTKVQ